MERVRFIRHNGSEILFLDFSKCSVQEARTVIDDATRVIKARPHQSILTLTDVTDIRFDADLSQRMKEFTVHNKPYVRAAAVIGVLGIKKILFEAVMLFSKRKLHAFNSAEEAKAWLATN